MRRGASILLLLACAAAADPLLELTRDPDRGVRYAAAQALGRSRTGIEELVRLLDDPEWCVRQAAGAALVESGLAAVPHLERVLRRGLAAARAEAAEALGRLGSPAVIAGLEDRDAEVRVEAAIALRRIPKGLARAAVPRLRAALAEPPLDFAFEAAIALLALDAGDDPRVEAALRAGLSSDWAKSRAAAALERLAATPREPEPLEVRATAVRSREPEERDALLWNLGPDHRDHAPHLRAALDDERDFVRIAAALALDAVGEDPRPELLRRLPDEAAARALAILGVGGGAPELLAAARAPSGAVREQAALALGKARVAAPNVDDPDPRARAAAVWSWARAGRDLSGFADDPDPVVREMAAPAALPAPSPGDLRSPRWRDRLRAVESGAGDDATLAALLSDPIPPLALAAADALARRGAAVAVARAIGSGHEATWHLAERAFRGMGERGAAAASELAALLAHGNVNVRETAARCLARVGRGARAAAPALVRALGDRRLCVVANAALALGAIRDEAALGPALADPRARVRAHAAFALGWMRAEDPPPYEPRLPVMECGYAETLYEELLSSDPRVAIPFAATLEFDRLDAWESERVMELLLPEGFRVGGAADFHRVRSILATSELPAAMEYFVRARRTEPSKVEVFGHLHRMPVDESLPAIHWFERNEPPEAMEGFEELLQPEGYTARYLELVVPRRLGRPVRPAAGGGLHPDLAELLRREVAEVGEGRGLSNPVAWWLLDSDLSDADAALLVESYRKLRAARAHEWALESVLRALGRASDAASERFLRSLQEPPDLLVEAALAQRGLPDALGALVARASADSEALALLLEVRPGFGAMLLRRRLLDPVTGAATARGLRRAFDQSGGLRIRWDPRVFEGIEEAALGRALDGWHLLALAANVPFCRTRRVGEAAFAALESGAPRLDGEEDHTREGLALLHSADPARFVRLMRRWAEVEATRPVALEMLMRAGDAESAAMLVREFAERCPEELGRVRTPEVARHLLERARAGDDGALSALSESHGFPVGPSGLASGDPLGAFLSELTAEEFPAWVRIGLVPDPRAREFLEREAARRRLPYPRILAQLVLAGDAAAREAFWSVLRAGRYRWTHWSVDAFTRSMGMDPATFPHWIDCLDGNCCMLTDGYAEELFTEALDLGIAWLYGREHLGIGVSPRAIVLDAWRLYGGRFARSPILDRHLPVPE